MGPFIIQAVLCTLCGTRYRQGGSLKQSVHPSRDPDIPKRKRRRKEVVGQRSAIHPSQAEPQCPPELANEDQSSQSHPVAPQPQPRLPRLGGNGSAHSFQKSNHAPLIASSAPSKRGKRGGIASGRVPQLRGHEGNQVAAPSPFDAIRGALGGGPARPGGRPRGAQVGLATASSRMSATSASNGQRRGGGRGRGNQKHSGFATAHASARVPLPQSTSSVASSSQPSSLLAMGALLGGLGRGAGGAAGRRR